MSDKSKSSRDRPTDLLAEKERRGRSSPTQPPVDTGGEEPQEWVGVALRLAGDMYLVAREETREILPVPGSTTRVPGAKQWIKGLANVRGQLLTIIDLRQFLGGGETPMTRNTRVVVVNHREIPAGLIFDEVLGFRRFADEEFALEAPPTEAQSEPYLAGCFRRGEEQWPVLSLRKLLESPAFADASA